MAEKTVTDNDWVQMLTLVKSQSKAIQRVQELHLPNPDSICTQCGFLYPCPTIEALDGEK